MGSSFDVVGVVLKASTGRSLKIELNDLPFTTFAHTFYVSINEVKEVLAGHRKAATIYILKPKQRALSCESHKS